METIPLRTQTQISFDDHASQETYNPIRKDNDKMNKGSDIEIKSEKSFGTDKYKSPF